jgi:hypothetical protein
VGRCRIIHSTVVAVAVEGSTQQIVAGICHRWCVQCVADNECSILCEVGGGGGSTCVVVQNVS